METWLKPFNEIVRSYGLNPNVVDFGQKNADKNILPGERLEILSAIYLQTILIQVQQDLFSLPQQTYGNFFCKRCKENLIIPHDGQYLVQQRRADEAATIRLECPNCAELYYF